MIKSLHINHRCNPQREFSRSPWVLCMVPQQARLKTTDSNLTIPRWVSFDHEHLLKLEYAILDYLIQTWPYPGESQLFIMPNSWTLNHCEDWTLLIKFLYPQVPCIWGLSKIFVLWMKKMQIKISVYLLTFLWNMFQYDISKSKEPLSADILC